MDLQSYDSQVEAFSNFEIRVKEIDENFDEELKVINNVNDEEIRNKQYSNYKERVRREREKLKEKRNLLQNKIKYSFEEFLAIIKLFILSPIEKKYINNIESEIKKSEELDEQIDELSKVLEFILTIFRISKTRMKRRGKKLRT